jgi:methylmalonyl-CoA decarboxylase
MHTSSRQSLTWSAHNAVEECRNSSVKGDAAETGLLNGNGQITSPEAPNAGKAIRAAQCAELPYFGGFASVDESITMAQIEEPAHESMEEGSLVKKSLDGHIGTITLDNPSKHNALGAALMEELLLALSDLPDAGARAIVLRAYKGAKVWSAGHDVRELPTNGRDPLTYDDPLRKVVRMIKESPTPIVAMVEGSVWGGACEVVMSCDIVIAAEGTTFAITPAKLGVPYDIEGTLSFMQSVSLPVIKEMLFTAQPITAERALRVGIINQVVPAERLESATKELAGCMIQNSPLVISLLKEQLRVLGEAHPLNPEGFQRIQAIRRRIYDSADYREGIRAFFERRAPKFEGR